MSVPIPLIVTTMHWLSEEIATIVPMDLQKGHWSTCGGNERSKNTCTTYYK